jgi:hypothetical protein
MFVIVATRRLGTKNSNGTTASCPYTNLNGVFPVNFLHVVMYAHNTAGIFKSQLSLFDIADLCQCVLKDLIKGFHCSICLRMIWCTLLMINFKLLSHSLNSVVNEVSALVTHQNPWASKSSDHLLKQEVCCCLRAAIFYWCCFCPSC